MVLSKIDVMSRHFDEVSAELKTLKGAWMTINDVVDYTGLSRSAVNANRQAIGFSNSGNCIRFKRSDVTEFMEQNYSKSKKRRL